MIVITACSDINRYGNQEELPENIISLKNALELSPENETLRYMFGKALYDYSLNQAIEKSVSEENLPFLLYNENNSKGCLMIHGFTATPWELRELGEYLFGKNITVYGVLLEGHGTSPEDLDKTKWQDWYKNSEEGLLLLSYLANDTYICGQSAGALLALKLAEENEVKGVIAISSPIYLKDKRANFAYLLAPFDTYHKNKNINDNEKVYYYEKRSARSIAELMKLIKDSKRNLNKMNAPTLIIQSSKDTRIETESAQYVYDNIKSKRKELMIVNDPEHVLTTGEDNKDIFERIVGFIRES